MALWARGARTFHIDGDGFQLRGWERWDVLVTGLREPRSVLRLTARALPLAVAAARAWPTVRAGLRPVLHAAVRHRLAPPPRALTAGGADRRDRGR